MSLRPGPDEEEKEAAARAIVTRRTLRIASESEPLPCESIDLFDTRYDDR